MNERIKELAKQAITVEHGVIQPRTKGTVYHFDKEKFAELIVRECADIANKQFSAASGLDDRDCWTAAEIKKHFGIEE